MPPVVIGAVAVAGASVAAGGVMAAFAVGGIVTSIAQFGAGLILSGAAAALQKKPKIKSAQIDQSRTITVREPAAPRQIVYGRARKGGTLVFLHVTGDKQQYLHMVIALAGHKVQTIGSMYFDGVKAAEADGTPVAGFAGFLTVDKRLGTETQSAFTGLIADAPDKWDSNRRLKGIACAYVRLKFDAQKFPNGVPSIAFEMQGSNQVYDPRTLTTGYTNNAALCVAHYMASTRYGLGAAIGAEDGLDTTALIEAANVCDEAVALKEGGTEPRYQCNGVFSSADSPENNIQALLTSMAGRAVFTGGRWFIRAGAYRTPTVAFTDDDVREAGLTVTTRISRAQNFNGVRGTFISSTNDWQPDDFAPYKSATYIAEDGGEETWRDIALPFTTSPSMAQRLAKIELERNRRQQTVIMRGKLSCLRAKVGDTVTLTYARWGYSVKPFEVVALRLTIEDGVLVPELTLRETASGVYDWTSTEQEIYAQAPTTTLPNAFTVPAPGIPTLSEELYETRGGVKAVIRAIWTAAPSSFVVEYRVQARRTLDALGVATGDDWRDLGRTPLLQADILDANIGTWEVQVQSISGLGVVSAWSMRSVNVGALSTPPAVLGGVTLQTAGGLAILKWTSSSDLDVRIGGTVIVRHSASAAASWLNSVSMDQVAGAQGIAVVPLKPGTYFLRAKDSAGVLGDIVSVDTKGAQALPFVTSTSLVEDAAFSGAKTNCELDGSELKITNLASGEGVYEFATVIDLTVETPARLRSDIEMTPENTVALFDDAELFDSPYDFDGTDGVDADVIVEVSTTDDDPAGSPTWSAWSRLDSSEDAFRGARLRARLIGSDTINVRVSRLRVYADEVV